MIKREDTFYCDFCGKSQHEVKKIVAAPDSIGICDECVVLAAGICDGGHPKPAEWHQAQIDLVRDAERYRALRERAAGDLTTVWVELPLSPDTMVRGTMVMGTNAKYLDAATDLLLAKQQEKPNGL